MVDEDKIYIVSGHNIRKIVSLLSDLGDVAVEYANSKGDDSEIIKEDYQNLILDIISSDIFEDIELEDLIGEYNFNKILKNVGLTTNRRR